MVSEREKEDIRNRIPLEDVIREYNIPLLRSGRGYKALCPFHAEKTPSFYINVEGQYFHCFGCEERGDLFTFVQKFEHLDFVQAVQLLARRAGVELSAAGSSRARVRSENIVELYDVLNFACDFYHHFLLTEPAAHAAREYLSGRGIELAAWEAFKLGFSPPEGKAFLCAATNKGLSPERLEQAGLVRRGHDRGCYDYFRGRVMFPISNAQSRTVGFGARILSGGAAEKGPKYLNTPKTPVFDKSRLLYGLPQSRETIHREGRIAVVEGYTDVIMAHQAGLNYFVASLGTAFTEENARQLSRMKARVWMVFDGDVAGQKAAERSLEVLVPEDMDVRIYTVPDGADPCETIRSVGAQVFQGRMEREFVGLFDFKWRRTVESARTEEVGPIAKGRALDEWLRLLARVPNKITQKLLLREFSERIGVDEKEVDARFKRLSRPTRRSFQRGSIHEGDIQHGDDIPTDDGGNTSRAVGRPTATRELEQVILECILALPHNAADMWKQVPKDLFRDDSSVELVAAMERQLESGELSPARLVREVQIADAQRRLIDILGRIQPEAHQAEGQSTNYEDMWGYAQGDIRRYLIGREIEQVSRQMEIARQEGDTDRYRELIGTRLAAKKKLKLMKRPGVGSAGESAG